MNESGNLLALALTAKKMGNNQFARETLLRLVEREAWNEQAWLHLSEVAASAQEAAFCLRRAAEINPKNLFVKMKLRGLQRITGEIRLESMPSTRPAIPDPDELTGPAPGETRAADQPSAVGGLHGVGYYLVQRGILRLQDLDRALFRQRELAERGDYRLLGQVLVDMRLISKSQLDEVLDEQQGETNTLFKD